MRTLVCPLLLVFGLTSLAPLSAQEPSCPPPDSLAGFGAILGQVVDVFSLYPVVSITSDMVPPQAVKHNENYVKHEM